MIEIQQSRLCCLIMDDLKTEFLFEIIDSVIQYKIYDFVIAKLMTLGIQIIQDDIEVIISLEENSFKVLVSESLEDRLKYFEELNPEYFI